MKTGILLINLGTPKEATVPAVRAYLREFLSDPKVIDLPWFFRTLLVNLILLTRVPRSVEAYRSIWLTEGSPLLVYTYALQRALSQVLGDQYVIGTAMRYGKPPIADALTRLKTSDIEKIIVLPLFPQYSRAVTGSVLDVLEQELKRQNIKLPVKVINSFADNVAYIDAFVELIKQNMQDAQADYLLLSYHGLPERQMAYNPNYQKDCLATSEAIATQLKLSREQYQTSFQSRLGRTPWIKPYTDEVLVQLRQQGVKRLVVVCPSFVVDCLETLEEIGIRAQQQWLNLGGESFKLVPCLNDSKIWVSGLAKTICAS